MLAGGEDNLPPIRRPIRGNHKARFKADRTPGYRGMHSFTLAFESWRVPEAQLVGGEAGLGRGFALQMAGFAAGRLQTGGRACGVTQAAVEQTARYVTERNQDGAIRLRKNDVKVAADRVRRLGQAKRLDAGSSPRAFGKHGVLDLARHFESGTLVAVARAP